MCALVYSTRHKITESKVYDFIFIDTVKLPSKNTWTIYILTIYKVHPFFSHCHQNRILLIFLTSVNITGRKNIWLFCRRFLIRSTFILCLLHMVYFLLVSYLSFNYTCDFVFGDTEVSHLCKSNLLIISHLYLSLLTYRKYLLLTVTHSLQFCWVLAWQCLRGAGIHSHDPNTGKFPQLSWAHLWNGQVPASGHQEGLASSLP